MNILGIETSCDETAAAVLSDSQGILSNIVLSQDEIHAPYGGIVPELASRHHIVSITYIVDESLRQAEKKIEEIDVFAVTQGPGLIGSLLVGLNFAKGLAYYFNKPLIPVDHLEAHTSSILLENQNIAYPALALLVSGGHTSLFFQKNPLESQMIAKTRDDAAGEALDKIAKFLELGYPGGPIIDRLAQKGDPNSFPFSLPQMTDGSLDYSFSGFKTAALRYIKKHGITREHPQINDFLASFEQAIIRALLSSLEKSVTTYSPSSLILCGGVARNQKLRKAFAEYANTISIRSYIPSPEFCTDNAAMVAVAALEKLKKGKSAGTVRLPLDL
ncbi:MAG: tRNA (adenosine(37)-N6)-threonylcarbamoyltransferase complex transferase subunit TsaD, partial [Candidatus Aminicenantes bacterium]|nr:tRNA (adenosine(37)-N6)-threonylcarbamoyltransferase complex transferase subunit TsaD [Candidatus Aminicenantes bacterium]